MALGTRYGTIIGIEVHAQQCTASKMFCTCTTNSVAVLEQPPKAEAAG